MVSPKAILAAIASKKILVVCIAILFAISATIQNSGWKNELLIVFRWIDGKGLQIFLENRSSLHEDETFTTKGYSWKYDEIIEVLDDVNPFKYIPPSRNEDTWVIIHSQPSHYKLRHAIRYTWGNEGCIGNKPIKIYFLLGREGNITLSEQFKEECSTYEDIILEDFIDSKTNGTIKSLMMLKHLSNCCFETLRYIIKTADNVYLNVPYVYDYLPTSKSRVMVGNLNITRNIGWENGNFNSDVSNQNYSEYLIGPTYVMSIDVVRDLYLAAQGNPPIPQSSSISDEYITGILPYIANVTLTNHQMFMYVENKVDICVLGMVVAFHNLSVDDIIETHRGVLLKNLTNCSGTVYFETDKKVHFQTYMMAGPKNPEAPPLVLRDKI